MGARWAWGTPHTHKRVAHAPADANQLSMNMISLRPTGAIVTGGRKMYAANFFVTDNK